MDEIYKLVNSAISRYDHIGKYTKKPLKVINYIIIAQYDKHSGLLNYIELIGHLNADNVNITHESLNSTVLANPTFNLTNTDEIAEYYGFLTLDEFNQIRQIKAKLINSHCAILRRYIKNQPSQPYIHLSRYTSDTKNFIEKEGSWFGHSPIFMNPKGFWFSMADKWANTFGSCDTKIKMDKLTHETIIEAYNPNIELHIRYLTKMVDFSYRFIPNHIYTVNIDKLNVKRIASCADLHAFEVEYSKPNPSSIADSLDWTRIKADWDGLILQPWKGIKCVPYYKQEKQKHTKHSKKSKKYKSHITYKSFNNSLIESFSDAVVGKVKLEDVRSLWQLHWDADSGVIWKNYKNLHLKKLV
jgi:hypothetical protein